MSTPDRTPEAGSSAGHVHYGSFNDVFGDALRGVPASIRGIAAEDQAVPVEDWLRPASRSDRALLDHCRGATIDVGCGPGRMSAYLALQGHFVLGVDLVQEAVDQARRRGIPVMRRNVFDPMPGEGHWDTVLLADGNIGIGGAPLALLRRMAELIDPTGRIVCDLSVPGTGLRVHEASLITHRRRTGTFGWAHVGPDVIEQLADDADLRLDHVDEHDGRWFAVLSP